MPLIVIHGDDDVIPATPGLGKHRVRRNRTFHIDPLGAGGLDRRDDLLNLLPAKESVFATMGIEAGYADAGTVDPQVAAGLPRDLNDLQHPVLFHPVTGFPQ